MEKAYKEYRNTNMVVPPLDFIVRKNSNPSVDMKDYSDIKAPEVIYSRWCRSNYLDTKQSAIFNLIANISLFLSKTAFFSGFGFGIGESSSLAGGNKTINFTKANKSIVPEIASDFCNIEKNFWNRFYFLQTFEPHEGYLGEEKIGKRDEDGYVGYKISSDGVYLEGYFYKDSVFRGVRINPDGERFLGTINMKTGFESECYIIKPDGTRKFGSFINNELIHGTVLNDTNAFSGEWKNGELNGTGFAIYNDETGFRGEWNNGKPIE